MPTDADLERFLDESLPADQMATIEGLLRSDGALQQRLAAVVGRRDAGVHSLGAVWRRRRLSCPTREQLGSHLLGVLEPAADQYVHFHLAEVGCRFCLASVDDLRRQHSAAEGSQTDQRRRRYFQSSVGLLSE